MTTHRKQMFTLRTGSFSRCGHIRAHTHTHIHTHTLSHTHTDLSHATHGQIRKASRRERVDNAVVVVSFEKE